MCLHVFVYALHINTVTLFVYIYIYIYILLIRKYVCTLLTYISMYLFILFVHNHVCIYMYNVTYRVAIGPPFGETRILKRLCILHIDRSCLLWFYLDSGLLGNVVYVERKIYELVLFLWIYLNSGLLSNYVR